MVWENKNKFFSTIFYFIIFFIHLFFLYYFIRYFDEKSFFLINDFNDG